MDPFDVSDGDLRAAWSIKWTLAPDGVLPAWVAEMDASPCPPVHDAVRTAVERGTFGYAPFDALTDVREGFAAFAAERFGWPVDPALVVSTGDVMAGVEFVLETLCDPGPVVVPVPAYPPLLNVVPLTGRALVTVPAVDAQRRMDVGAVDAALAAGARTVLLTNPHNPLGRAWTRAELEALRDVVDRHGARVVSDDIHAPLVLPGATYLPYATLDGTAGHVTTVTSASKAFNTPGLKAAQIVTGTAADAAALRAVHYVANHGMSPLGLLAAKAAWAEGGPWLDAVVAALADRREQLTALLAERLPAVRWTPPEATYLAWLDLSEVPGDDPVALALDEGRVMLSHGPDYGPGLERSTRLAFATSAERLERIVDGLARAWGTPG